VKGKVPVPTNLPQPASSDFSLQIFEKILEKLLRLEASIEVLKALIVAASSQSPDEAGRSSRLAELALAEQQYLSTRREEFDEMMKEVKAVLRYAASGSLPEA